MALTSSSLKSDTGTMANASSSLRWAEQSLDLEYKCPTIGFLSPDSDISWFRHRVNNPSLIRLTSLPAKENCLVYKSRDNQV